jgi:uracil-DNA glycosylase family 4
MLVGQDPTVRKFPERVSHVLMLDQPNGQLSRWLRGLLGDAYDRATVYATNVVKCSFSHPPSEMDPGGLAFLRPYAKNCRSYLAQEIALYKPSLVLTLGEPSHVIFREVLDDPDSVAAEMKNTFGRFIEVSIDGVEFRYSPCLHIQTFRVAETYGPLMQEFKLGLEAAMSDHQ